MSRLPTAIPNPTATPDGPAWTPAKHRLGTLRERSARRQLIRDLAQGKVRRALIKMGLTQHRYGKVTNSAGRISELVAVLNLIELAVDAHSFVLAGNPAVITVAEEGGGFEAQKAAIAMVRSESHFDGLLMRATAQAYLDGETPMRPEYHPTLGTVIRVESVAEFLPVGADGPDMQPTVWERRWSVERIENRRTVRFLRVERHRVIDGRGVVEQEAYEAKGLSVDLYADLAKMKRVPLVRVIPAGTPADVTETGLDRNTVVRLVTKFGTDGFPKLLLDEGDIDLYDTSAAAFSRLARTMEQHGKAKMRGAESMVGPDGTADLAGDFIVDEDKLFEYILADFNFDAMNTWASKVLQILMVRLQMSPSLHGLKHDGGATPDTYDKQRLEATATLMRAGTSKVFFEPALETLFWTASMMESMRGLNGWPVGEVDATLHPEIPADLIDRARAWAEIKDAGLVDEETAVVRLHGEGAAPGILARLKAERAERAKAEQAALFGSMGFGARPAEPATPATPPPPSTDPTDDPATVPAGGAA